MWFYGCERWPILVGSRNTRWVLTRRDSIQRDIIQRHRMHSYDIE